MEAHAVAPRKAEAVVDLAVSRKNGKANQDADALKRVRTLSGAKALDTNPNLSGEKVGTRFTAMPPLGVSPLGDRVR